MSSGSDGLGFVRVPVVLLPHFAAPRESRVFPDGLDMFPLTVHFYFLFTFWFQMKRSKGVMNRDIELRVPFEVSPFSPPCTLNLSLFHCARLGRPITLDRQSWLLIETPPFSAALLTQIEGSPFDVPR